MKISKLVVFILGIFVLSGVCLGYNPTDFDCSPYLDGSERMVGDVNGDGQVNGVDSHMVSMYLAHLIDFDSSYGNCCVDVDADSKVSVKDVLYIEKYVNGLISKFKNVCTPSDLYMNCKPYNSFHPRLVGDLNGDYHIDMVDADLLSRFLAQLVKFDYTYGTCCIDLNADSHISVKDTVALVYFIEGNPFYVKNTC